MGLCLPPLGLVWAVVGLATEEGSEGPRTGQGGGEEGGKREPMRRGGGGTGDWDAVTRGSPSLTTKQKRGPGRREEAAPSVNWEEGSGPRGSTTKGPGAGLCLEQTGGRAPAGRCRRGALRRGRRGWAGASCVRGVRESRPRRLEGKFGGTRAPSPRAGLEPFAFARHGLSCYGKPAPTPCPLWGVSSSRSGISGSTSGIFTRLSQ